MPAPAVALALLSTPPTLAPQPPAAEPLEHTASLTAPVACPLSSDLAAVAAGLFGRGPHPQQVGLTDPGSPLQREQAELQTHLAPRFGDLAIDAQLDRQLGRR